MGRFDGFPPEALSFFEAVAANTSWEHVRWLADLHERAVRAPMERLTDALAAEFGPAKVYNLHRSPDLWAEQRAYVSRTDTIALGVGLSLEGLAVEGGWLLSSSDQVARFRWAVGDARTGSELTQIVAALEAAGYERLGRRLMGAPPGFARDHERADLLRHRSLAMRRVLGRGEWLETAEAATRVRRAWRELAPLVEWLTGYVGPRDRRR